MEQGIVLNTERLILREFKPEDTDALLEVLGDPVAMQYYPAPLPGQKWKSGYGETGRATMMPVLGSGQCFCGIRES